MSQKNLLSHKKLVPILLVLISAFFLQAFRSPGHAIENRNNPFELVSSSSHDVIQDDNTSEIGPVPNEPASPPLPLISASIKADPLSGTAPLTVEFSAKIDSPLEIARFSVRWSFGNGDTDNALNTKYTFTEPGEYRVTLEINDGRAEYLADSVIINVHRTTLACDADCLIATKLQLDSVDLGDTSILIGSVLVTNENGRPIEGAEVRLVWTRPDGRQLAVTEVTNREGIAQTHIQANIHGLYFLQVAGIEHPSHTFDPTHGILETDIRR